MTDKKTDLSFEQGFERLETILEKMQSPALPLETSLALFEEGDHLIKQMSSLLSKAEKRVEKLLKNDSGSLTVDESGKPQTEPFMTNGEMCEIHSSS